MLYTSQGFTRTPMFTKHFDHTMEVFFSGTYSLTILRNLLVHVKDPIPPRGDENWCGIPDLMPGLSSNLRTTEETVVHPVHEGTPIGTNQCSPKEIHHCRTWDGHRACYWLGWCEDQNCMPHFYQTVALETWYMRSQPHTTNWEEGIPPPVCNMLTNENDNIHHALTATML